MSKPLVVSIPHRLGKDEAVRRLKNGLGSASANFGHVFKVEEANLDRNLTFSIGSARLAKWQAAQSMWPRTTFDWRCFCHGSWRSSPKHCSR